MFAALSAGRALAGSDGMLIAARAVQGIGAAAIVPGSLALIAADPYRSWCAGRERSGCGMPSRCVSSTGSALTKAEIGPRGC